MGITKRSARHISSYSYKTHYNKRGQKCKITPKWKLSIKRAVKNLELEGKKVNCTKIKQDCNLKLSTRTIQRYMLKQGMAYKHSKNQIVLTKKHKEERIQIISHWISSNHE